jgi:hypothetical protein
MYRNCHPAFIGLTRFRALFDDALQLCPLRLKVSARAFNQLNIYP